MQVLVPSHIPVYQTLPEFEPSLSDFRYASCLNMSFLLTPCHQLQSRPREDSVRGNWLVGMVKTSGPGPRNSPRQGLPKGI